MRIATWSALTIVAALAVGCSSTSVEAPEDLGAPTRTTYAAVPGESFLRGEKRTILCDEAKLELPLHLEAETFVVADKVRRETKGGVKYREALGQARVKFGEGIEIRECRRILVSFCDCDHVKLSARGHVVFLDQSEGRVVRGATVLSVNGADVKFGGPAREEKIQ